MKAGFAKFLLCLSFVFVSFFVYWNTLGSSFHMDDFAVIVNNPAIRNLSDLWAIFNAFNTRFLTGLTIACNYAISKNEPGSYHLFNILIHGLASFMVYLVARQFQMGFGAAVGAAFLFLLHPIQTQAVNLVWQRSVILACFFYLLSIYGYARFSREGSKRFYGLSLLACGAAMFSKEIAVTLPVALALYDILVLRKRLSVRLLPHFLFALTIPVLLIRQPLLSMNLMKPNLFPGVIGSSVSMEGMMRWVPESVMPAKVYWMTQAPVWVAYGRLLLWPVDLNLDHDFKLVYSLCDATFLSSAAWIAGVLVAAFVMIGRSRVLAFFAFWFFLCLILESTVIQQDVLWEHRLYLPMAAFSIFAARGLSVLPGSKKIHTVIALGVLVLLSGMSYQRNTVWMNEFTLWSDVIQKAPNKARGYNQLAVFYNLTHDYETAIEYNLKALALDGKSAKSHYNLGVSYFQLGDTSKAIESWKNAVGLDPYYEYAWINLADAYFELKDYRSAQEAILNVIRLSPGVATSYNLLGACQLYLGDELGAKQNFEKAIDLDPLLQEARNNLQDLNLSGRRVSVFKGGVTNASGVRAKRWIGRRGGLLKMGQISVLFVG